MKQKDKILNSLQFFNIVNYKYNILNWTTVEIGEKYGFHPKQIVKILKKHNIILNANKETIEKARIGFSMVHRKGLLPKEASKKLGVSVSSITKYAKSRGVYYPINFFKNHKDTRLKLINFFFRFYNYKQKFNFSIPQELTTKINPIIGDIIMKYYYKNYSIEQIVNKNLLPLQYEDISKFYRFNNFEIKNNHYFRHKDELIHNFKTIDTEEKAYWLGFLMADGCVTKKSELQGRLSLALSLKDINHLIKFKKFMKSPSIIREYLVDGKYPTCSILINNINLVNDLIELGVVPNKTEIAKFPKFLPDFLVNHFIRGLMDGDGSIPLGNNKPSGVSILGTKDICKNICKELKIEEKYLYKKDSKNLYEIRCNRDEEAIRILREIYKNSSVFLERKHSRFLDYNKRMLNK